MALNGGSSNKYMDPDSDSEHYYQNHQKFEQIQQYQQQYPSKTSKKSAKTKTADANDINLNLYPINGGLHPTMFTQSVASNSSAIASSTASSDRPFLLRRKRFKISYFLLILGIMCLIFSLISIAISFIFPFWIRLTIVNANASTNANGSLSIKPGGSLAPLNAMYLNLTNFETNISLIVRNSSHGLVSTADLVQFDLGLWEVKMQQELQLVDLETGSASSNDYPQSMLWINYDLEMEDFLFKLLKFIDLKPSYIFIGQILQILHFIFTFLGLCFTSFTLCLCTNHRSSLSWYLVSFFICLIAFLTGLAVIIMIVAWQTNPILILTNQFGQDSYLDKSFNWCFWLAVGINSCILLASLLTLLYILLTTIMLFNRKREAQNKASRYLAEVKSVKQFDSNEMKNASKLTNRTHRLYQNGSNTNDLGLDTLANYQHMSNHVHGQPNHRHHHHHHHHHQQHSGLPRIPANMVVSNTAIGNFQQISRSATIVAPNLQNQHLIHQGLNPNSLDTIRSPSYIFYTGHGNYHKQEIILEKGNKSGEDEYKRGGGGGGGGGSYDNNNDFMSPPSHLVNYSFISKAAQQNSNTDHHPYSNVIDQHADYKFANFK